MFYPCLDQLRYWHGLNNAPTYALARSLVKFQVPEAALHPGLPQKRSDSVTTLDIIARPNVQVYAPPGFPAPESRLVIDLRERMASTTGG